MVRLRNDLRLVGLDRFELNNHESLSCWQQRETEWGNTQRALLGESLVSQEFGVNALQRRVSLRLGTLDAVSVGLLVLVVVGVVLGLGLYRHMDQDRFRTGIGIDRGPSVHDISAKDEYDERDVLDGCDGKQMDFYHFDFKCCW